MATWVGMLVPIKVSCSSWRVGGIVWNFCNIDDWRLAKAVLTNSITSSDALASLMISSSLFLAVAIFLLVVVSAEPMSFSSSRFPSPS
jgi:hypothetical protein